MFQRILAAFGMSALKIPVAATDRTAMEFIEAAKHGLIQQTSVHATTWHLGEEDRWSADLDDGTITLHFKNGMVASASIQVVGTYNRSDGTFLWGWDHPSVPENLRHHAQLVQAWGDENKIAAFTTRKVQCSEDDAWAFAAVANRLGNANGVYRGPDGTALVFMTFGEIQLKTSDPC